MTAPAPKASGGWWAQEMQASRGSETLPLETMDLSRGPFDFQPNWQKNKPLGRPDALCP